MLRRIIALAGAAALAATALAGPQAVASRAHIVNAGVVILDSSKTGSGAPVNAAPFAFYNLDKARSIKPAGWQFVNPHAPTIVTADIAARWQPAAVAGSRVTKAQAPYWEVFLTNASDATLADYDVLLVAPAYLASLNPSEREKLRRFVDKGGLLWIDPAGMAGLSGPTFGIDTVNNFPLPFGLAALGSGSTFDQSDFSHPLLTTPNGLTQNDMRLINGGGSFGLRAPDLADESAQSILPIEYPVIEDFYKLRAVSVDTRGGTTLPTLSVGRIGDGYVVVTARAAAINLSGIGNTGYTSASTGLTASGVSSARLAINMVSLLNDFRQYGGGTRKTNSTIADVNAPLLRRWQDNSVATTTDPHLSQPTIYKGLVYVSVGNAVRCYEADPNGGLTPPGQSYVWQSKAIQGPISAPVAVDVPDVARGGNGLPEDQVLVTDGSGQLVIVDATPPQPGRSNTNLRDTWTIKAQSAANSTTSPNPPTVDEGIAYMVDTASGSTSSANGRVWMVDLRSGTVVQTNSQDWIVGGKTADFPAFSSSASVAYIPTSDNSDGVDKVLYIPFNPSASAGGSGVSGFSSLWVGTKGERPVSYQVDTTQSPYVLQVDTRALQAGNLPIYTPASSTGGSLGPRITLLKAVNGVATGDVYSAQELKDYFTGQVDGSDGQLRFTLKGSLDDAWFKQNVAGIRVDYTIDWGRAVQNGIAQAVERGRMTFSSSDPGRRILGNLAVSSQGTVFAVYSDPDMNNRDVSHVGNGGTVYAFKEDAGRGSFRCVMRYDLYPSHSITPSQGTPIPYKTNFQDLDAVQGFMPSLLGGDVQNMVFMGGPCVRGDQVYVVAAGQKVASLIPVDVTVLLAFKSEPDTPTIKVGDLGDNISLVQPDFLRTADSSRKQPQVYSILQPQAFKYERETGTIRVDNLMGINRGQIQNCLSLSQPVLIRRVGQGDTLIEPEATGGRWSPLQWYAVLHGLQLRQYGSSNSIPTTPVVAGDTLYVAATSLLPKILNSGLSTLPTAADYRGMCYGLNVNLGPNDPYLVPTPARSWNKQFVQLVSNPTLQVNTNVLWPQLAGTTDMSSFIQRVNQTVLGSGATASHMAFGIVAGDNAAVAWGDQGLYAFTRADVLVCDQKRVARFDAAGNLLWSSDASLTAGENAEATVGKVRPLLRPTRAYPIGTSDLLVVDSGGNRIVRMNAAGTETRSIDSIRLDPSFIPDGWTANESTAFNNPRDVTMFAEYVDLPAKPVFTNQTATEYWVHHIVADTGNRRIVELVDRYNVGSQNQVLGPVTINNVPQLGVLLWHSPTALSGKGFAYSSLVRVYVPGTSGNGHFAYVAGIGSSTPTRSSFGLDTPTGSAPVSDNGGNGGFVLFDPTLPGGSQVYNAFSLPDISATKLWNESTNAWDTGTSLNLPARQRPIGAVNSVTAVANGNSIAVMVADSTGVYEGTITTGGTPAASEVLSVDWMLPNAVYRTMRRVDPASGTTPGVPLAENATNLGATYARRLDSGEILIVNGYAGSTRGTKLANGSFANKNSFLGEVIQIDGSLYNPTLPNLGFYGPTAIKYELRGVTNGREIIMPVFADRR